jgi:hypothetical protein
LIEDARGIFEAGKVTETLGTKKVTGNLLRVKRETAESLL